MVVRSNESAGKRPSSEGRYLDDALARIDVVPARHGRSTTMPLTVVADGDCVTNLCGVPVDQIVLTRTAGASSPAHGHAHAEANVLVSR